MHTSSGHDVARDGRRYMLLIGYLLYMLAAAVFIIVLPIASRSHNIEFGGDTGLLVVSGEYLVRCLELR